MTTNRDWLFSLPLEEQYAWMNAEHQDCTLDGDTAALNAKIAELERKLRISWEYECKFQDERDALQEQVDTLRSRHCPHYDANEHTCDVHETRIAELTAERDEWKSRWEIGKAQFDAVLAERELYREALSQLLDTVTDGMSKVSAILDNYDEGMA